MKDKKIQKLVDKLSNEYSDVVLFLYDKDRGQTTMAVHCTTQDVLPEIAARCILQQAESDEIDPSVILMSIICGMVENGALDIEKFKQMCPFFIETDTEIKEN